MAIKRFWAKKSFPKKTLFKKTLANSTRTLLPAQNPGRHTRPWGKPRAGQTEARARQPCKAGQSGKEGQGGGPESEGKRGPNRLRLGLVEYGSLRGRIVQKGVEQRRERERENHSVAQSPRARLA